MSNLKLLFCTLFLTLLCIEVVCVAFEVFVPGKYKDGHMAHFQFLDENKELCFLPKKNLRRFRYYSHQYDMEYFFDTDEEGFRNVGESYDDAELFFVGDSFTWGAWIPREKTFVRRVADLTQKKVINLGIGGLHIEQYEAIFKKYILKWKPKHIALAIFANDLNEPRPIEHCADFFERYRINERWKHFPMYRKLMSYQLYTKLRDFNQPAPIPYKYPPQKATNGITLFYHHGAHRKYLSTYFKPHTESAITNMMDMAEGIGSRLTIFLLPSKESAYKEHYETLFPEVKDYLVNEEVGYQAICALAFERGIECLDLTEAFRNAGKKEVLYFDIDAHWNERGHEIAARVMADTLGRPSGSRL